MLRAFLPGGYRNLRVSEKYLPQFGRINLLVGPNNAGKSNFIRALGFLPEMLLSEGGPTKFLHTVERHGRAEVLNRNLRTQKIKGRSPELDIYFYWMLDGAPQRSPILIDMNPVFPSTGLMCFLGYRVGDSADFPSGFHLQQEAYRRYLGPVNWRKIGDFPLQFGVETKLKQDYGQAAFFHRDSGAKVHEPEPAVKVPIAMNETVFAQKAALLKDKQFYETMFPEFMRLEDELLAFARGFHSYASTDLDVRQLAEGAKIDLSVRALDAEGSQFVNVLRYLDQKYDFLDEYAERLRELCPDLRKLKVIDASDTYKQLELNIGGHKYKPREMSDGTLKAMWLALLLFSPEKGSVLSIDEPEMNLHPAWLKVIGRWLQRFSSAEQLFVSTHSPDLLDTFTEGFKTGEVALFVFGLGDKEMRRVEPGELESFWKDGWELGDLYRVGEPKLGGWPW